MKNKYLDVEAIYEAVKKKDEERERVNKEKYEADKEKARKKEERDYAFLKKYNDSAVDERENEIEKELRTETRKALDEVRKQVKAKYPSFDKEKDHDAAFNKIVADILGIKIKEDPFRNNSADKKSFDDDEDLRQLLKNINKGEC